MKKLITITLLLTNISSFAALMETVQGHPGNAIETLKCIPKSLLVSDPTSAAPCRNPLSSTTTTPTILIESAESEFDDQTNVELVNEVIGESSKLTATTNVAEHLDLSIKQVQEAVIELYNKSEVSIENIEQYYGL